MQVGTAMPVSALVCARQLDTLRLKLRARKRAAASAVPVAAEGRAPTLLRDPRGVDMTNYRCQPAVISCSHECHGTDRSSHIIRG